MSKAKVSSRERIVLVAERSFAQHGLDGVSLRQIGAGAGNSNNSAVQYYFGTKERLIRAIFDYRLPTYLAVRHALVAERRPDDLRSWLECQIEAVFRQSEVDGSAYLSFLAMLRQAGRQDVFALLPEEAVKASEEYELALRGYLGHLAEPLRTQRLTQAMGLIVQAGADRESSRTNGRTILPYAVQFGDLLDGMTGFLKAPVSSSTQAALDEADPDPGPRLLTF